MARNIDKNTIYQNMSSFFGFGMDPIKDDNNQQKVIIKGNSPEDIKRKALEIEQREKLREKYFRTTDRGFQKALQYEAARLPAYMDYEGFEYYPIIASALDLFMEEATSIGLNGKMLNIYSNKERIKYLLEELFNDIINVNVNLPFWTRSVCKYGDNFVLLYGERKKGITHVKQMVNYEIERYERIEKGRPNIRFKERMTGDEFNVFEMAHFRLLGDDRMLPYGNSVLNKVRRVTRQLILGEDAMLTYRIIRAGEKKVFKIDVGNIDDDDIEDYIYKVATKFKKTPQIDPNNGQIDYRFNILGNDEDYFIPVRNANVETGIDTLQGAQNLNDINDIEYLRDNLFTGLGIPKPFLSFQDAQGGGKNMAQYDIRFAKKINRIQQAMIQELNKIAMIHLYLLGYDKEDLNNFTLTLTNPSIQGELQKAELLREKSQTFTELTRGENGIAAMSHTDAMKMLFNMSDKEVVENLKKQKLEKVIMQELADAPVIIKKTGLFNDIDQKYGEPIEGELIGGETGDTEQTQGGEVPPIAGEEGAGEEGGAQPPIAGLPNQSPADLPPVAAAESVNSRRIMTDEEYNNHVEKLVYGKTKDSEEKQKELIKENDNKNDILNQNAETMIKEIDSLIDNALTLNEYDFDDSNIDDVDIDDLEFDDNEKEKQY
ncbi:MAG: portal protein [bacterium]